MRKAVQLFFFSQLMYLNVHAQDHLIQHDLVGNKTRYYKVQKVTDTTATEAVIFKKNGKLTLKVDNFNPYYWQAKVSAVRISAADETAHSGLFNPFSILSSGLGGLVESVIPALDLGAIAASKGGDDLANDKSPDGFLYWAGMYNDVYGRFRSLMKMTGELKLLKLRIIELKFDIAKPSSEIKQSARDAVKSVLGTDYLDFETILKLSRKIDSSYTSLADSLQLIVAAINRLVPNLDPDYYFEGTTIRDVNRSIQYADSLYQLDKNEPDFLHLVSEVALPYRDIQNSSYSYTYTINSANEYEQLRLQIFSRKDSLAADTITRYFPISPRGYMRLRNSVGVAFSYFTDKNRRYFVLPDSTIGKSSGDLFTPVISTFIHFYGYRSGGFKMGGAVGFGIPVTGEKLDINYMIGLSGIIGKNEPIIISTGISGTKVQRLAKGWSVGSKVPDADFDIPTVSVFRAGFFLSITFNLGRMTVKSSDE